MAKKEVNAFKKKTEEWICKQEWKYDENENNLPLRIQCNDFAKRLTQEIFPKIVREELTACSEFGRNLATVLQFDCVDNLIPEVPQAPAFWGKVGSFFVKTFKGLRSFGGENTLEEQERLSYKLEGFCNGIVKQIDKQRKAIEKKVQEVMR